jgi:hypothetical protein
MARVHPDVEKEFKDDEIIEDDLGKNNKPSGIANSGEIAPEAPTFGDGHPPTPCNTPPGIPGDLPPEKEEGEAQSFDVALAEEHLKQTSCSLRTEHPDGTVTYTWRSIWGTSLRELGFYGVGVQLYFEFLMLLGIMFTLMGLTTSAFLEANLAGDMLADQEVGFFERSSVGNLGWCGTLKENCPNITAWMDRPIHDPVATDNPNDTVRNTSEVFGLLDVASLVLFLLGLGIFYMYRMKKIVQQNDDDYITPADFSIHIMGLPRKLQDAPEDDPTYYENKLKDHLIEILSDETKGLQEIRDLKENGNTSNIVCEISLARNYHGAIKNFLNAGSEMKKISNLHVKKASEMEQGKKVDKTEKELTKLDTKIEKSAGKVKNVELLDHQREVCMGFVIFNKESYKKKMSSHNTKRTTRSLRV